MLEAQKADLANKYGIICVYPFFTAAWFRDSGWFSRWCDSVQPCRHPVAASNYSGPIRKTCVS